MMYNTNGVSVQLERENAAAELDAIPDGGDLAERGDDLEVRYLWERMNGAPGELLYAGEYKE